MECEAFVEGGPSPRAKFESYELQPLEEHHNVKYIYRRQTSNNNSRSTQQGWKGPLKALRLLILVAVLPAALIAVPLYMRYFVFSGQMYPLGMSDMRLIDKKVSTTWCQRQVLHSNASFKAFLTPTQPKLADHLIPVSMTRELSLADDMKEYWGFYLLQGSIVTVSTCVSEPGASLIMIRGHKHLQECAYIGDDSSEEQDELDRIQDVKQNRTLNRPDDMVRLLNGIQFHEPRPRSEKRKNLTRKSSEEKDIVDTLALKKILHQLQLEARKISEKREKIHKNRKAQLEHKHIVTVPQLTNRYRDTNVNEDEKSYLSFKELEIPHDSNDNVIISNKNSSSNKTFEVESHGDKINSSAHNGTFENQIKVSDPEDKKRPIQEVDDRKNNEEEDGVSSGEILEEIIGKLSKLGNRGKGVLNKLNEKLREQDDLDDKLQTSSESDYIESFDDDMDERRLNVLKKLILEVMEQKEAAGKKRSWKQTGARRRRDIVISQAMMDELNDEDERGNVAIEEGFMADGIADHHHIINETTPNDMSNSEFWSSFSSSEEALLECDGLILNLPLRFQKDCKMDATGEDFKRASLPNTVTYHVPTNGYYFFVFNSENEVNVNYIRVRFDMQKTIYDLTNSTVKNCTNGTESCALPLSFWSSEKVVLEVPLRDNDSLWNEEYMVTSECEPRTALYVVCVIMVPVLFVLMAFQ